MKQRVLKPGLTGFLTTIRPSLIQEYNSSPYLQFGGAFCCTLFACLLSITGSTQILFGSTRYGGANNNGAIIKLLADSNKLTPVFSFDSDISNGVHPYGSLMQVKDGKFYGMTSGGGSGDNGVIYSFDPADNIYTKLINFNGANGRFPEEELMQATDGKLYGMTNKGGSIDSGVIFSLDPATNTYTKVHDFGGTNGTFPDGSLMQATDGKLYGTTNKGGSSGPFGGHGVIFSFDPATNIYTKVHDFDGTNGEHGVGVLIQVKAGKLYGMTWSGGDGYYGGPNGVGGIGVIFSFDRATNTL